MLASPLMPLIAVNVTITHSVTQAAFLNYMLGSFLCIISLIQFPRTVCLLNLIHPVLSSPPTIVLIEASLISHLDSDNNFLTDFASSSLQPLKSVLHLVDKDCLKQRHEHISSLLKLL